MISICSMGTQRPTWLLLWFIYGERLWMCLKFALRKSWRNIISLQRYLKNVWKNWWWFTKKVASPIKPQALLLIDFNYILIYLIIHYPLSSNFIRRTPSIAPIVKKFIHISYNFKELGLTLTKTKEIFLIFRKIASNHGFISLIIYDDDQHEEKYYYAILDRVNQNVTW